jgi:hypothetical protein
MKGNATMKMPRNCVKTASAMPGEHHAAFDFKLGFGVGEGEFPQDGLRSDAKVQRRAFDDFVAGAFIRKMFRSRGGWALSDRKRVPFAYRAHGKERTGFS